MISHVPIRHRHIAAAPNIALGKLSFERIEQLVAAEFHLKPEDLHTATRRQPIALARQIAMWLAKENKQQLNVSLADIAQHWHRAADTIKAAERAVHNAMLFPHLGHIIVKLQAQLTAKP